MTRLALDTFSCSSLVLRESKYETGTSEQTVVSDPNASRAVGEHPRQPRVDVEEGEINPSGVLGDSPHHEGVLGDDPFVSTDLNRVPGGFKGTLHGAHLLGCPFLVVTERETLIPWLVCPNNSQEAKDRAKAAFLQHGVAVE